MESSVMSRRTRILACGVIVASIVPAGYSWAAERVVAVSGVAPSGVSPLAVFRVPTPPLMLPNYHTSGTYVQVSSTKVNVKAVNAALRDAVVSSQRQYSRYVRQRWMPKIPESFRPDYPFKGTYRTSPKANLISASTIVVSALIPVRRVLPGGTGGGTWISVTVQVPSGVRVGLRDLFTEPSRGLRVLATAARENLVSRNSCIRASASDPIYAHGFAPTVSNYRRYALTTKGLVVGFWQEQVGAPTCTSVTATVPYAVLRPYLSRLGEKLIAGARQPRAMKR